MPRIKQFLSTDTKQADVSAGSTIELQSKVASQSANSLKDLGKSLSSLASSTSEYIRRSNILDKKTRETTFQIQAAEGVQDANNFALENRSESGDNLVSTSDEEIIKKKKRAMQAVPLDQRGEVENIWDATRLSKRESLFEKQRKLKAEYSMKVGISSLKDSSNIVFDSPDDFTKHANIQVDLLNVQNEAGIFQRQDQKDKVQSEGLKTLSMSAVNGLVRNESYDEAIWRLEQGDLGSIILRSETGFGPDQHIQIFTAKERGALIETIRQKRMNGMNQNQQLDSFEDKRRADELAKTRKVVLADTLKLAMDAKNDVAMESVMNIIDSNIRDGVFTKGDVPFLTSIMDDTKGTQDNDVTLQIHTMLADGVDTVVIKNKLKTLATQKTSLGNPVASSKVIGELMLRVFSHEKTQRQIGKAEHNKRVATGKQRIVGVLGSKDFWDKFRGKPEAQAGIIRTTQALADYNRMTTQDPLGDTMNMANEVLLKTGVLDTMSSIFFSTVPIIEANRDKKISGIFSQDADTVKEVRMAIRKIGVLLKTNKITDLEFDRAAAILTSRKKFLIDFKQMSASDKIKKIIDSRKTKTLVEPGLEKKVENDG